MTLQEIITDVEAVPEVLEVTQDAARNTPYSFKVIKIRYLFSNENSIVREGVFDVMESADQLQAFYLNNIPVILREVVPTRAFLMTEDNIKAEIISGNAGWEVVTLSIQVRDNQDIIRATIDTGTDIIEKEYRTWQRSTEVWVQPTGAHDAYPINSVVEFTLSGDVESKLWKSLVDANVWEPGTDVTLWEEITEADLTSIKPVV